MQIFPEWRLRRKMMHIRVRRWKRSPAIEKEYWCAVFTSICETRSHARVFIATSTDCPCRVAIDYFLHQWIKIESLSENQPNILMLFLYYWRFFLSTSFEIILRHQGSWPIIYASVLVTLLFLFDLWTNCFIINFKTFPGGIFWPKAGLLQKWYNANY